MSERLSAKCLCGSVKFSAEPEKMEVGACHCGMCRHWSGGVFLAVGCGQSVVFESDASVGIYKSSQWGQRVFCKECGSSLVWQTNDHKHQSVSVQAFEDVGKFRFSSEIFIDAKPGSYSFAQDTIKMTEAEVMAMFAPSGEGENNG